MEKANLLAGFIMARRTRRVLTVLAVLAGLTQVVMFIAMAEVDAAATIRVLLVCGLVVVAAEAVRVAARERCREAGIVDPDTTANQYGYR